MEADSGGEDGQV